jgi:hypothetical protein
MAATAFPPQNKKAAISPCKHFLFVRVFGLRPAGKKIIKHVRSGNKRDMHAGQCEKQNQKNSFNSGCGAKQKTDKKQTHRCFAPLPHKRFCFFHCPGVLGAIVCPRPQTKKCLHTASTLCQAGGWQGRVGSCVGRAVGVFVGSLDRVVLLYFCFQLFGVALFVFLCCARTFVPHVGLYHSHVFAFLQ